MACFNLGLDPIRELVLEHGRAHIGQPLLRDLRQLKVRLRQVGIHLRVVLVQELSDFLYTQAFESDDMKRKKSEYVLFASRCPPGQKSSDYTYCGMWIVRTCVVLIIDLRPPSNSFKK